VARSAGLTIAAAGDQPSGHFRAAAVARPMAYVQADAFPLAMAAQPELDEQLLALSRACAATETPAVLRATLDDLSWSLLDATLSEVAQPVLARTAQLAARHKATLTPEHQRLLAAVNGAIAGRLG
jgi:hypothetical protein